MSFEVTSISRIMDEVTTVVTIQPLPSSPAYQIAIAMERSSDTDPEIPNHTSSSSLSDGTALPQQQTPIQPPAQEVTASRDNAKSHVPNAKQPTEFELFIKDSFGKLGLHDKSPSTECARPKATRGESSKQEEMKRDLARRRLKCLFPISESDDDHEQEGINANLESLSNATKRLKGLAVTTGEEICIYPSICRPTQKGDPVDEQVVLNRARLDRIR